MKITKRFPPAKKGKKRWQKGLQGNRDTGKGAAYRGTAEYRSRTRKPRQNHAHRSHLWEETKEEIIACRRCNADIFAWTPQDLEGIDPKVITHHLNIDPGVNQ
ncbi:UNVERIFIED_CONTAM: hypothetical protein Slati_2242400 [Sesamum latifolium]|uniref:HNH endonuclease n=1 Tax=Sesamum latifolium TaxID=2727402 RepID=A0AAW2WTK1_9LAMI